MNAHLYRIPSTYANVPDEILIRAKPMESFPGHWLHAELPLPETMRAIETEYGDGCLVTDSGEVITSVYPGPNDRIDGSAISGTVTVYGAAGDILLKQKVSWR